MDKEYGKHVVNKIQLLDCAKWYMEHIQYPLATDEFVDYLSENNIIAGMMSLKKINDYALWRMFKNAGEYRRVTQNYNGHKRDLYYYKKDIPISRKLPVYDKEIRNPKELCEFIEWYMINIEYPAQSYKIRDYAGEQDLIKGKRKNTLHEIQKISQFLREDSRFVKASINNRETNRTENRWYFKNHSHQILGHVVDASNHPYPINIPFKKWRQ